MLRALEWKSYFTPARHMKEIYTPGCFSISTRLIRLIRTSTAFTISFELIGRNELRSFTYCHQRSSSPRVAKRCRRYAAAKDAPFFALVCHTADLIIFDTFRRTSPFFIRHEAASLRLVSSLCRGFCFFTRLRLRAEGPRFARRGAVYAPASLLDASCLSPYTYISQYFHAALRLQRLSRFQTAVHVFLFHSSFLCNAFLRFFSFSLIHHWLLADFS